MVGAGLVSIPWAFSNSGIILGLCKQTQAKSASHQRVGVPAVLLHVLLDDQERWKGRGLLGDSVQAFREERLGRWHGFLVSHDLRRRRRVLPTDVVSKSPPYELRQTIFPVLLALLQWIFGVRQPFSLDLSFGTSLLYRR